MNGREMRTKRAMRNRVVTVSIGAGGDPDSWVWAMATPDGGSRARMICYGPYEEVVRQAVAAVSEELTRRVPS